MSTLQTTAASWEAGGLCIFPSEQCGSVGAEHFVIPWRDYATKSQDIKRHAHFLLLGWHPLSFLPAHSGLTPFPTSRGCLILATQSVSPFLKTFETHRSTASHRSTLDPSIKVSSTSCSRKIKPSRGKSPPGRTSLHPCSAISQRPGATRQ